MVAFIVSFIQRAGYAGIALLMFVETLFPPIPSELILPFAGFTAGQGKMSLLWIIVFSSLGSMLGTLLIYTISRLLHEKHVLAFIHKYGRYWGITEKDFHKSQAWFDRNGYFAVFLCRLIPGVRSLISIPAGVRRMKFGRFFLISLVGTCFWNALLSVGGYILGDNYHLIESQVSILSKVILYSVLVIVVGVLLYRLVASRKRSTHQ